MNWQLISFFGDSTVLLPSAAALFIVLMLRKTSRLLAWQWSLLFGITGAIVCASKLAFMGWGLGIRELDYTGFSGHSALSAAFWPIFLWLLSARFSVGLRKAAVITGYVLAAVVGYSRLVIHAHSVSEVIAGLLLGAAGSALFLVLQKRTSDPESVNISWGGVACPAPRPLPGKMWRNSNATAAPSCWRRCLKRASARGHALRSGGNSPAAPSSTAGWI